MSNIKRFTFIVVLVSVVVWSMGGVFVNTAYAAPVAGDLIKMTGNPAVYYFDGTKRYVFPMENIYKTWYTDFSKVVTISPTAMGNIMIGGNVTVRPGTWLVKITTDPKVYAVEGGKLRHVDSEARAVALYGAEWYKKVIDVRDDLFVNYTLGSAISSNYHPVGTLIKYANSNQVYYVDTGNVKRPIASEAILAVNLFQSKFIVTTDIAYADGSSITRKEEALVNVAGAAAGPVVVGGTALSVALASDTPASTTLASGSAYNPVLKLNFTAGSDGAINITGLKITKSGLLANTNIAGVGAFGSTGKRYGNFVTSLASDNTANLTFTSDPIIVSAGQTTSVWIKINALAGSYTGTSSFSLVSASAVTTASSTAISGTFPVTGNTFSFADGSTSIAAMTFALQALGNSSVDIGTVDHQATRFRVSETSGKEDLKLAGVALYNNGNAGDADFKDVKLYAQDGSLLATSQPSGKYIRFALSPVYVIPTGTSRDFTVKFTVVDGSTRTIKLAVQESYDVEAYGALTGAGILSSSAYPSSTDQVTVNSGDVTLSKSTASPSGKIAVGGKDVVLAEYDIRPSGENFEFRNFYYSIKKASGGLNFVGTVKFQINGVTLYSVAGADAKYVTSAPGTIASNYANPTLTSYQLMNSGTTYKLRVVADISSSATSADNYTLYIGALYGKRMSTNDFITKPDLITVTAGLASNNLTVDTSSLILSMNTAYPATTIVKGASNQKIGSFTLQAGASEGVRITSMKVTLSAVTGYQNVTLKVGATQLGNPISTPIATTGNAVSMTPSFDIPASGQKVIDVYADTTSAAVNTAVTLGTIVATGINSATTISSPADTGGQAITVSAGGVLTLNHDNSGTPVQQVVHADEVDKEVFRFKVISDNVEDLKLNTLHILAYNGGANFQNFKLYDGTTLLGGPTNLVGNDVNLSGLNFVVPKGTTKTLRVIATSTSTGTMSVGASPFANFGIGAYEYVGAAGTTTKSGGTYASYANADDLITVNNISLFTTSTAVAPQGVYIDANGDGDIVDTSVNGLNETTNYFVCAVTATSGGAGTITLATDNACATAPIAITANSSTGGYIVTQNFVSRNMYVADVEPVIMLTSGQISGAASPSAQQDVVKFDIKADGSRDLTVKALAVKTSGSYTNAVFAGTVTVDGTADGASVGHTITIDGTAVVYDVPNTTINTAAATAIAAAINANSTVNKIVSASASSAVVTIVTIADFARAYTLTATTTDGAQTVTASGAALTGVQGATVGSATTQGGGIYDWQLWQGGTHQTATLKFGSQAAAYVTGTSATRLNSGYLVQFVLNSPIVITAGSIVTFTVKANTSSVKSGVTSGNVSAATTLDGVSGNTYSSSSSRNGLIWTYTNINGTAPTTESGGTPTLSTNELTISDSYAVVGPTWTY